MSWCLLEDWVEMDNGLIMWRLFLENFDILFEVSKLRIDFEIKIELLIVDKLFLVNEWGGVCNKGSLYFFEIIFKIKFGVWIFI